MPPDATDLVLTYPRRWCCHVDLHGWEHQQLHHRSGLLWERLREHCACQFLQQASRWPWWVAQARGRGRARGRYLSQLEGLLVALTRRLARTQQVKEVLQSLVSIVECNVRRLSNRSPLEFSAGDDGVGRLTLEAIDIVLEMKRLSRWTL
jgi:hypothetical protein